MTTRFEPTKAKARLLQLVRERAYKDGIDIVLASGKRSTFYINGKKVSLHPEGLWLIAKLLLDDFKAPWVKVEIYNVLNNQKQIAWDRTVTIDQTSARDANGIPTGFIQGPRYGTVTSDSQYPQPWLGQNGGRAYRMAVGVRF